MDLQRCFSSPGIVVFGTREPYREPRTDEQLSYLTIHCSKGWLCLEILQI